MRIVLDTNILARAASGPPSPAAELLLRCISPPYVLCSSPFLLSELSRVLRYPRVSRLHGMTNEEIDVYVRNVQMASLVVDIPQVGL
jgi:predicted nucleic acid-binding protein